jgi:hypothetical protein
MYVDVDREAGVVRIDIRSLPPGVEQFTTTYLAQHGLYLHWDGRGTLTGVEVRMPGERVSVVREVRTFEETNPRRVGALCFRFTARCSAPLAGSF